MFFFLLFRFINSFVGFTVLFFIYGVPFFFCGGNSFTMPDAPKKVPISKQDTTWRGNNNTTSAVKKAPYRVPGSWDPASPGAPHFASSEEVQIQNPNSHI